MAPVNVVFSYEFLINLFPPNLGKLEHLDTIKKEEPPRTARELQDSGKRIIDALQTVGITDFYAILEQTYEKLAHTRGMGPASLSLLLDVVTTFGFSIQHEPPAPASFESAATALAVKLKLRN